MDVPTSVKDIALFEIVLNDSSYALYLKGQLRNIKITELKMGNFLSSTKKKK